MSAGGVATLKPSSSRDVSAEAIASLASGKRAADHSGIRSSSTISSCKKRSAEAVRIAQKAWEHPGQKIPCEVWQICHMLWKYRANGTGVPV